jgi:hypothetical protein
MGWPGVGGSKRRPNDSQIHRCVVNQAVTVVKDFRDFKKMFILSIVYNSRLVGTPPAM